MNKKSFAFIGQDEKIFVCDCHDKRHQLWLTWDSGLDKNDWDFTIEYNLNPNYSFFKRIKYALAYIFNYPSGRNWGFDTVLLNKNRMIELRDFVDKYVSEIERREKEL